MNQPNLISPCRVPLDLIPLPATTRPKKKVIRITKFNRTTREQIVTCDIVWSLLHGMAIDIDQPKTRLCINAANTRIKKIQNILFNGENRAVLGKTDYRKYQRILQSLKRFITNGYGATVQLDYFNAILMMVCRICDAMEDNSPGARQLEHWQKLSSTLETIYTHLDGADSERNIEVGVETLEEIDLVIETA